MIFLINGKKVVAVIPARGGSKGVLRKNLRNLAGKPLIAWTIEAAAKSKYLDRILLSSDDNEIIELAKSYGCEVPFVRPAHLATDDAISADVILHALDAITPYDYVIMLQPTSPLRTTEDIDLCIETLVNKKAKSCVSISESSESPYWMFKLDDEAKIDAFVKEEIIPRRQDLPIVYSLNGAVYIAEINWFKKKKTFLTNETVGFIMPRNRSYDIDTNEDFLMCEYSLDDKYSSQSNEIDNL
ncbi:N-acylneuraminate cytidylyltransferase [Sporosarcina newyorkensis 2681]|uniref:N-acylneuraminate cytidylyltransferase n=1 Tax=Sporosarcina newyorkensis 2681 TaxID=1027292 RepID=F9DQ83_9BACL|nr:N-acylneuraminate cytidylyltransferase [Sporosarcina newyorkensis 2681]